MPPEERFVPRFAAEPPQDALPYGRWEQKLREEFLAAAQALEGQPEDIGETQSLNWFPDRSWHGRTYVPATAATSGGYELFGFVRYLPGGEGGEDGEPADFIAHVDVTDETAERNPDWRLDICDEVIGSWRGEGDAVAAMTLVWGRPLISGGAVATAELAGLAVDQCEVREERFTLIAPDDYRQDLLEIKLFDGAGRMLAAESLYDEQDGQPGELDAADSG